MTHPYHSVPEPVKRSMIAGELLIGLLVWEYP
jgi:hypothetical protein